ncbi:MAG TPA: hypothetical protein VM049_07905 [Gaiellaceae bacterium]|nr:hypothetical protein [Gaiellaceae bacterium]
MRKQLEGIEISGQHEARERSWAIVQAAFAQRERQPRRRSWRPVAAIALLLVVAAGLLSPPGRAVLDGVRDAVGVEKSEPALFSLPAPGRLLVTADSGAWVVDEDGSKRRLGSYREASWSPFGRFVVASRRNELVALTPGGEVRWTLARPDVRFPRWGGTNADTRIAYLSEGALRVVGGDGRGDRLLDRLAADRAPAWQPGRGHRLAYARRDGTVRVVDADTGALVGRDAASSLDEPTPTVSPDGRWRVVGWADADQLVFTRLGRPRQIRAVSNVSAQFRSRSFPTISGWCCAP